MRRPLVGTRRDGGQHFLLITIVAFAVTVMAVRVFLDTVGYPKVGGGGLHVAHMLWGGLLLVVAAILLQLFVGRRTLTLSALAAGIGVGLFIDEVGKFITESNDYFFAPAAPVIYGAILVLVLFWLVARRDDQPGAPEAIHGAIEALHDLADGQLTASGRDRAVRRLDAAGATPGTADLGGGLLAILGPPETEAHLAQPGWVERGGAGALGRRYLPDRLERLLVRIGLLLNSLEAIFGLVFVLIILGGEDLPVAQSSGPIEIPEDPVWLLLLGLVWVVVGLATAVALVISLRGHHVRAMAVAQYAVLISLVAGGLLSTYVSQLGALSNVLLQLLLLLLVVDQRRRLALTDTGSSAA